MTMRLHVSVQGGFLTSVIAPPPFDVDVFVINGSALKCIQTDSHAAFISYTQPTIETTLTNYLTARGIDYANDTRYFVLDMEHPGIGDGGDGFAHPNDLGEASASQQDEIVTAWKTRIAVARTVLPNAKIGMYGLLVPNSRGLETDGFIAQRAALIEAGVEGLYDSLDYLVPILFPRFGPDDNLGAWHSYPEYTRQGVDSSRMLVTSTGAELPLFPMLHYRVSNGPSLNNDDLLLDLGIEAGLHMTLIRQLSVLAGRNVEHVSIWIGSNDTVAGFLPDPNDSQWTLNDFLVRIMPTTTVTIIRDQMLTVIEGLSPTSSAGVKFRGHRDESDFFEWCGTNKAAALRRIEVRGGTSYTGPDVTNTDVEWHRVPVSVTVAYPLEWGKYGLKNRASLEKVVEEDMHQIDDAIGVRGMANWTGGSFAVKVDDDTAEQDGVLFVRMKFEVGYYRSV